MWPAVDKGPLSLGSLQEIKSAPLLLASGSPRRRELLEKLGIPFEVAGSVRFQELVERENAVFSPSEFVWYNAVGKALAAAPLYPGRCILAADTVVTMGGRIFGKPRDRAEAEETLAALSGRSHWVQTGVAMICPHGRLRGSVERTEVVFRKLSAATRRRYLDAVHVADKAGSYSIQDHSDWLVSQIKGSFSNVMGLPLERVAQLVKAST